MTYKELVRNAYTNEEKCGLQSLLGITDGMLKQSDQTLKKAEFAEYLKILDLEEKFPKKLKVKDAMLIRSETLENVKYTDNIQLLPYIILQKIFMHDCRSRVSLFNGNLLQKTAIINDLTDIHPMDSMLALLHCCDNFLRQEILFKLSTCQMAIPLLLPNPHDGSVEFLLWATRSIIKSWKCHNNSNEFEVREHRIADYPAPIISFLKVSQLTFSKSKLLNEVISDSKEDYFFNWDCEGGSSTRLFTDGLVEMCCYMPSGKNNVNDFFQDILFFINLHGDAQQHMMQTQFIEKVSFMACLLLTEGDINAETIEVITKLCKLPGGLILIFPELNKSQSFQRKETTQLLSSTRVLKLGGKNYAQIRNELRQEIVSTLLGSKTDYKRLSDCAEIVFNLNIKVDENDETCSEGKFLAENVMEVIKAVPITKAKEKMLPLQSPNLWHKWASFDKESYRQLSRSKSNLSMKEYSKDIEERKRIIRCEQNDISAQTHTELMDVFLDSLMKHSGTTRLYFVHWLQMFLDDYSRQKLPKLSAAYHETRQEMLRVKEETPNGTERIQNLKEKLHEQNDQLIHASFGIEHLFREMGQIYEAGMDPGVIVPQSFQNKLAIYPQVIVDLMEDGYPVELMDGDTSHVPETWVLAIMQQIKNLHVKSNRIFVISVLGIQSTGKSTLLNTANSLSCFCVSFCCSSGALSPSVSTINKCDWICENRSYRP